MQDKVFLLNLVLKCVRSSDIPTWSTEVDHTNLDHSEPDYVAAIHKLKTIKRVVKLDYRQHEIPVHMCIKIFNTTDTICRENCWISWVQVVMNREKQMCYLVDVDHNSMAVHLTRSDCEVF
jgi:hypothetical protein